MATKYIVNKTKMAFQFQNGKVLEKQGVLQVEEQDLEALENDYFFKGLKERGGVIVSLNKPESLAVAGATIARNDAEIAALKDEIAELKKQLAKAQATGKETATIIDSNESPEEIEETVKKSSKKKA